MKWSRVGALAFLVGLGVFWGCGAMKPEDFANSSPKLVIEEFLEGKTRAVGILFGRNGEVKRQFTVEMHGTRDGDRFVLNEHFLYDDGETQDRVWTIRKIDEHNYEGTAPDVIGKAVGRQFGSALNWSYVLRVPVGERTYDLTFDDWMFLTSDGVLLNRAKMSKFGFTVGELVLSFRRLT